MNFTQAFNSAREELGAGGLFEYRGQVYNTWYKEEWDTLPTEAKSAWLGNIQEEIRQYAPPPSKPLMLADEDFVEIPANAENPENRPNVRAKTAEPLVIIPETLLREIQDEHPEAHWQGAKILPIDSNKDGMIEAIAVDKDQDGFVDILAVDTNHDEAPDAFFLNADGTPGLDLLAIDPNRDGTLDDLQGVELEENQHIQMDDLHDNTLDELQSDNDLVGEIENI
jgi:hypothetical protein